MYFTNFGLQNPFMDSTMTILTPNNNGRVTGGAAMREVVDPANASVVAETGFRCAADRVDPKIKAGQFDTGHSSPAPEPMATTGLVTVPVTIAPGVLFSDNFKSPKSGWTTRKEADFFVGYHAPSWYQVDASKAGVQAMSLYLLHRDKILGDGTNQVR